MWQKAMDLVEKVYVLIKSLPQDERFALCDQLRRAVVSVPANIAEGNGCASNRDYAHFFSVARGSLYETLTHIEVAQRLGYIEVQPEIESLASEIRRMLSAMINKYGILEEK